MTPEREQELRMQHPRAFAAAETIGEALAVVIVFVFLSATILAACALVYAIGREVVR